MNKWPRVARIARPGLLSRQLGLPSEPQFLEISIEAPLPALWSLLPPKLKFLCDGKLESFAALSEAAGWAGPGVVQSLKPTQPQTLSPHHLIAINKGQLCTLKNQLL